MATIWKLQPTSQRTIRAIKARYLQIYIYKLQLLFRQHALSHDVGPKATSFLLSMTDWSKIVHPGGMCTYFSSLFLLKVLAAGPKGNHSRVLLSKLLIQSLGPGSCDDGSMSGAGPGETSDLKRKTRHGKKRKKGLVFSAMWLFPRAHKFLFSYVFKSRRNDEWMSLSWWVRAYTFQQGCMALIYNCKSGTHVSVQNTPILRVDKRTSTNFVKIRSLAAPSAGYKKARKQQESTTFVRDAHFNTFCETKCFHPEVLTQSPLFMRRKKFREFSPWLFLLQAYVSQVKSHKGHLAQFVEVNTELFPLVIHACEVVVTFQQLN